MTASVSKTKKLSSQLSTLSTATRKKIKQDLQKRITDEQSQRLFYALYPDKEGVWQSEANKHFNPGETIFARSQYKKHLEFFRAGKDYRERCFNLVPLDRALSRLVRRAPVRDRALCSVHAVLGAF